jgi:3-hydroxybutyryl-CoA dehydratase
MRELPRACRTIAELDLGERFERTYSVTNEDLERFASLSGDWNPLHFDDDYAAASMFGRRIAHGLISLAKFSGIFGMDLPGLGTLWETQDVRFLAPVFLGRTYKAVAEVVEKDRRRALFSTWVEDEHGQRVLEGRASVIPISEAVRKRMAPVTPKPGK